MKDSSNLDVLRAAAVLLVVLEHTLVTFQITSLGFASVYNFGKIGVFTFFVHTSLVLMYSLQRTDYGLKSLFIPFYLRRAFRIYPLAIVCILIALALGIPPNSWGAVYSWPGYGLVLSNLLLIQNLTFPGQDSVIGPLWTLPIELQMYAVLPLLYIFVMRVRSLRALALVYLGVVVLGIVQPIVSYRANLFQYGPCFMGGILAFRLALVSKRRILLPGALWPLAIAGVAGIFIALESVMPSQVHRGWIMCFILAVSIPHFAEVTSPTLKRGGQLIAKYSYGIYLAHVPALWVAFTALGHHSTTLQWWTFVIFLTGVPVLLYHAVEQPGIAFGRSCVAALADRAERRRSQVTPPIAL